MFAFRISLKDKERNFIRCLWATLRYLGDSIIIISITQGVRKVMVQADAGDDKHLILNKKIIRVK